MYVGVFFFNSKMDTAQIYHLKTPTIKKQKRNPIQWIMHESAVSTADFLLIYISRHLLPEFMNVPCGIICK
jgi:hypothetical protein